MISTPTAFASYFAAVRRVKPVVRRVFGYGLVKHLPPVRRQQR